MLYWGLLIEVTLRVCVSLSMIIGISKQRFWVYNFLRKIKLDPVHPTSCSWDFLFKNLGTSLLRVNLTDGESFVGYLTVDSFSSSDITERDLYLEIKCLEQDGIIYKNEAIKGIYITHGSIKTIEVLDKEKTNEQRQQQLKQQSDKQERWVSTLPTSKAYKKRIPTYKRKRFRPSTATPSAEIRHIILIKKQRKSRKFFMDNKQIQANEGYQPTLPSNSLQHGYQPMAGDSPPPPPPLVANSQSLPVTPQLTVNSSPAPPQPNTVE